MKDLLIEYVEALNKVEAAKETANEKDLNILRSMASDLRYAIDWMKTGRKPGLRRGIERRAAYQNEQPLDPVIMQSFVRDVSSSFSGISESDRIKIKGALSNLTEREKEVYLLVRGEAYTRTQAAHLLGVSKGTINNVMTRCDNKIRLSKKTSLFTVPLAN